MKLITFDIITHTHTDIKYTLNDKYIYTIVLVHTTGMTRANDKPLHCVWVQSWILLKTYNSSRSMTKWRPTFAITSLLAKTHVCIGKYIYTHTHKRK